MDTDSDRDGLPTIRTGRRADGAPVYTFDRVPGVPPVGVVRFDGGLPPGEPHPGHAHAHDFLLLTFFERGGGSLRLGRHDWPVTAGDAFVIAPGEVVGTGVKRGLASAGGWAVFFPPDFVALDAPGAFLSWRAHPLLFPFVASAAGGAQRLRVPPGERSAWSERFAALERELCERRDGCREAVLAHLTLLLVSASRLAGDVAADLRLNDEPLLAAVFGFIEDAFGEPISLRDVAAAVGLTPGHLTTVVGRRTGRTVQQWITERRMAEARRLLVGTDETIEAVARRVGYRDPGHFTKHFRRVHAVPPLAWRRSGRAASGR